jgi:hypothetical protein
VSQLETLHGSASFVGPIGVWRLNRYHNRTLPYLYPKNAKDFIRYLLEVMIRVKNDMKELSIADGVYHKLPTSHYVSMLEAGSSLAEKIDRGG